MEAEQAAAQAHSLLSAGFCGVGLLHMRVAAGTS
jgi:hypothetical protein